jgi:hypothetical protein
MSKTKKQEEVLDPLEKIDLSQFAKPKRKKREPICKGCKTKDCDFCVYYGWQDLGYHVERIIETFSTRIGSDIAEQLRCLWSEKKEEFGKLIEKQMNKFGVNFIKEMDMKMMAEEDE